MAGARLLARMDATPKVTGSMTLAKEAGLESLASRVIPREGVGYWKTRAIALEKGAFRTASAWPFPGQAMLLTTCKNFFIAGRAGFCEGGTVA